MGEDIACAGLPVVTDYYDRAGITPYLDALGLARPVAPGRSRHELGLVAGFGPVKLRARAAQDNLGAGGVDETHGNQLAESPPVFGFDDEVNLSPGSTSRPRQFSSPANTSAWPSVNISACRHSSTASLTSWVVGPMSRRVTG